MKTVVRPWSGTGVVIGGVVLVVLVFSLGAFASRSHMARTAWMEGPGLREAGVRPMGGQRMMGGRQRPDRQDDRVLGAVTAVSGSSITLRVSGASQTVAVASTTSFYKQGAIAKQSDLQVSDVVVVFGAPDSSGTIQAQSVEIQ